ncbi:hypothetical protein OVA26_16655 [Microbacterium sp. SL62]|uniref:DUF7768 domain-containing protein n=1 Tax=Microbacterium sp. SL62 TaxID=2995139 RepID=UPI002276F027|nr:hypothetical protein [Microbacterium sp. SL62]MCY1718569.1 hypothetical protein [Microbacterium sp. SL62]
MSTLTFLAPPALAPATDEQVQLAAVLAVEQKNATTSSSAPERASVTRTRVLVETAFASDAGHGVTLDQVYAREALRDSLLRGEAPISSQVLYGQTFVLDTKNPAERDICNRAAESWMPLVDRVVVYVDRGTSDAVRATVERAKAIGVVVEERTLDSWKRG